MESEPAEGQVGRPTIVKLIILMTAIPLEVMFFQLLKEEGTKELKSFLLLAWCLLFFSAAVVATLLTKICCPEQCSSRKRDNDNSEFVEQNQSSNTGRGEYREMIPRQSRTVRTNSNRSTIPVVVEFAESETRTLSRYTTLSTRQPAQNIEEDMRIASLESDQDNRTNHRDQPPAYESLDFAGELTYVPIEQNEDPPPYFGLCEDYETVRSGRSDISPIV